MAQKVADLLVTPGEFLEGERHAEIKHEYLGGRVYAMSGGSLNHQRLGRNFVRQAANRLEGKPCEPTTSDFLVRIKLGNDEVMYYPDAMILCHPTRGDEQFTTEPTVILEVLSPHTRRIDETQKLRDYLTIPTLQTYLLAETDSPTLTLYRRVGDSFERTLLSGLEATLDLPEVDLSIPLAELYQDVSFPD
jgi:Uma2 family endonuclease